MFFVKKYDTLKDYNYGQVDEMTVWCYQRHFSYTATDSAPTQAFKEFYSPVLRTYSFQATG